jgi:hypothetical protein
MALGILLIACGLTGLWDGFTTFYGTHVILTGSMGIASNISALESGELIKVIASAFFAIIILGFLFGTKHVWRSKGDVFTSSLLRMFWVTAFIYDIYTSFMGNRDIIIGSPGDLNQFVILIGMTILVSGAPIIFSLMIEDA